MWSREKYTLPRLLLDPRLIGIGAVAGVACTALLLGFITRPNAQTVTEAAVTETASAAAPADGAAVTSDQVPCEHQHWPYIDRRCLSDAGAKHMRRNVRLVTTDRLTTMPDLRGPASADHEKVAEMDSESTQAATYRPTATAPVRVAQPDGAAAEAAATLGTSKASRETPARKPASVTRRDAGGGRRSIHTYSPD
jgi:hypothetical protein